MKILFVCKHNRFRSKVAEALFKQLNKNKRIKVSSAGLFEGNPISKNILNSAKRNNLTIIGKPRAMSDKLLKETDILVNVAANVPSQVFKHHKNLKTISWNIKDLSSKEHYLQKTDKVVEKIRKKVENLIKKLPQN
jgi:protein-tyrosine-phosphatase